MQKDHNDGKLRRLTLEQLRSFVALTEHGSFTEAARLQMRTQTAVTRQIKNLEDILDERVLIRSRGHFEGLTEAGQRLLPIAYKVLASVDEVRSCMYQPVEAGIITLGIMDDVELSGLNEIVSNFKSTHSNYDVCIISDFSYMLEGHLEKGEIDIAIKKQLVTKDNDDCAKLMRREPLLWATGTDFLWQLDQPLPLVVFRKGCIYRAHLINKLEEMGIKTVIAYEGQSYASVRAAVVAGFGITALSKSQIEEGGLLHIKELSGVQLADLGQVDIVLCHNQSRTTPPLKALIKEIRSQLYEK